MSGREKARPEECKTFQARNAVATGNLRLVTELVQEGLTPNAEDSNGWTLVHLAVSRGRDRVLRMLLEYGGNPLIKDKVGGFTAMHYAAMHGKTRTARLLLEFRGYKYNFKKEMLANARSDDGWLPIHVAAHYDRDKFVRLLLEYGTQVDGLSDKGTTALQLAIIRERTTCIALLLEAGADINVQLGFPLRYAVIKDNLASAQMILQYGASTSINRAEDGQTPLHLAALRNNYKMCKLLYAFGADVCALNVEDQTPLGLLRLILVGRSSPCVEFLTYATTNPRKLQDICRLKIRKLLGPARFKNIEDLPVSSPLKDFIKFKICPLSAQSPT